MFLDICKDINFLVSMEKTFWGQTVIIFLGLLIDAVQKMVCLPQDKIQQALMLVEFCLYQENRKVTV